MKIPREIRSIFTRRGFVAFAARVVRNSDGPLDLLGRIRRMVLAYFNATCCIYRLARADIFFLAASVLRRVAAFKRSRPIAFRLSEGQIAAAERILAAEEDGRRCNKDDREALREILMQVTDRVPCVIHGEDGEVLREGSISRKIMQETKRIAAQKGLTVDEVVNRLIHREYAMSQR